MPVTVYPAPHSANAIDDNYFHQRDALTVLRSAAEEYTDKALKLLQSSMDNDIPAAFIGASNGLVDTCIKAYSDHHHLKLRPEDIWITILTQFNFYVNAHAEELRSSFVAHEGKKQLVITLASADYSVFVQQMGMLIQENVLDPALREWIMPNFSTTTTNDQVTASIAMMATLQAYFEYGCCLTCGLPSKLDKLCEYGQETTDFANLLRPIVKRLIKTFDDPKDTAVLDFWNRIYSRRSMASGPSTYTGWITAFCFWDKKGKRISRPSSEALELDGVRYHAVSGDNVPSGYLTVPAKIIGNGRAYNVELFAGSVGMKCTSSGQPSTAPFVAFGQQRTAIVGIDTVSPLTGWWVYERLEGQDSPSQRRRKEFDRWLTGICAGIPRRQHDEEEPQG